MIGGDATNPREERARLAVLEGREPPADRDRHLLDQVFELRLEARPQPRLGDPIPRACADMDLDRGTETIPKNREGGLVSLEESPEITARA